MMFWPEILRPWWLLLLPLLGWLLWRLWHREQRIGRWQRLLPPAFHSLLLTRGRLRSSRLPAMLLGLAWLLALLALLGPSWQRLGQPDLKRAAPLVVMLEVTPAMLATDARPNRLEQAKRELLDLLGERPDAPTAVVVYAGSAHTLVPLSNDVATTANLLDAVSPAIMPEPGQRPDLAVAQALDLLRQGGLGRGRLLLIASSLGDVPPDTIVRQLEADRTPLSILGIGTPEGAPVPDAQGNLLKDASGAILLPRLDSAALGRLARDSGGRYLRARADESDLAALGVLATGAALAAGDQTRQLAVWKDQGYWLLLPLLLLAACAGRRGWLFALAPLMLLPAQPSHALEWQDLWLRPDQQGQRLLREDRPAEAAERFANSQWRGLASYLAGDYSSAAALFAQSDTPEAHYNRGNALARSEQLQAALEAYDQALELNPDLQQARHNRALVEQMLKERQAREAAAEGQPGETSEPKGDEPSPGEGDSQAQQAQPSASDSPTGEPGQTDNQAAAGPTTEPSDATALAAQPSTEQSHELDQWLRRIPDDPGELLRQKFLLEQRKRREPTP